MASTVLAHAAQRSSTALATADDCLAHRPGCSCVDTSMRALRFAATDLEYHAFYAAASPARKTSWAFVGFNLSNSAVGYQTACAAFSNRQDGPGGAEDGDVGGFFYGDVWFWCESTGSGGNDTAAAARFAYNRTSGELEISQRWTCRDDPMFPITFNATATVSTANTTCNDTSWTTSAQTAEQGGSSEEDLWERKVVCGPVNITFQADYLSAWE